MILVGQIVGLALFAYVVFLWGGLTVVLLFGVGIDDDA